MLQSALLALLLAAPPTGPGPVVAIYVGPLVRDGFVDVDQGVRDSIKDIKRSLQRELRTRRKDARYRIVDDAQAADVTLYVVSRGIGPPTGGGSSINVPGQILKFPNGQTVLTPGTSVHVAEKARYVVTLLSVGPYERAFVADDSGQAIWGECAKRLARDVSVWLDASRERVDSRK
jgi:hypothetical protein